MGIKKSVVLSTDVPLPKSNAAASSFVSLPTNKFTKGVYLRLLFKMLSSC